MGRIEDGYPVGHIQDGLLVKKIKPVNVLRYPERCFTIDRQVYEAQRPYIKRVVIFFDNDRYELRTDEFEELRIPYNYGNGAGYRIPIKQWHKTAEQRRMEL